jgi:hypothetical protein
MMQMSFIDPHPTWTGQAVLDRLLPPPLPNHQMESDLMEEVSRFCANAMGVFHCGFFDKFGPPLELATPLPIQT